VPAFDPKGRRLAIIDDDLLSREVLELFAVEAGFLVDSYESGEQALKALAQPGSHLPDAILADMQMPGISGDALAHALRSTCAPGAQLLAMSGTPVPTAQTSAFDHFLLKPFSIEDLCVALNRSAPPSARPSSGCGEEAVLNRAIYSSLAQSMSRDQLRQLYTMCLDDADARVATMRTAVANRDSDAFRRAAHSVKGGCGMVGALELARLAADMEDNGLQTVDSSVPPNQLLDEFLAASARLRRILDAQQ
jgi:CheY-like chemotaxis protein